MDLTQIFLTVTLFATTVFLIIVGIQLILVLKEARESLKKINGIIAGFEKIGGTLGEGIQEVMGFFGGVKMLISALDTIHKRKNEKHKKT